MPRRRIFIVGAAVVAVVALAIIVGVAGPRLTGGTPTVESATGTVRTADAADSEASYVRRNSACRAATRSSTTFAVVTVEWRLTHDPEDDSRIRFTVDGPDGWTPVACLPAGTTRTPQGFDVHGVRNGRLTILYAPSKPDTIPDLEPWKASLALEPGGASRAVRMRTA